MAMTLPVETRMVASHTIQVVKAGDKFTFLIDGKHPSTLFDKLWGFKRYPTENRAWAAAEEYLKDTEGYPFPDTPEIQQQGVLLTCCVCGNITQHVDLVLVVAVCSPPCWAVARRQYHHRRTNG